MPDAFADRVRRETVYLNLGINDCYVAAAF